MKVIEIAFTVYAVTDLKRSRLFYENVLGLTASSEFGDEASGWVEYEIGPHTLALGAGSPKFKPSPNGGAVAFEVEDFDVAIEKLKASGVSFSIEPTETPVCHIAVIADPDGNSIIIHKRKSS
ncbi:MAG TPA: VOC family protein [Chthoniobacterales bacterium]